MFQDNNDDVIEVVDDNKGKRRLVGDGGICQSDCHYFNEGVAILFEIEINDFIFNECPHI